MACTYDFTIEENSNHEEFCKTISQLMNEGYKLHGDLKIISIENAHGSQEVVRYIQALYKETIVKTARSWAVTK